MAYAAVASLSETINLILNHHQQSISPEFENRITSLHEHIVFLQSFLEDFPEETDDLEERTREVASAAEDIIELLLTDSLLKLTAGSSGLDSNSPLGCDFDDLERVAEEIGSIAKGVKERRKEAAGGFDEDLMEIVSRLQGGSSERETIAIVGRGGIGKTTLANKIYENLFVGKHFHFCSWVTVTQDYSLLRIAQELLLQMGQRIPELLVSEDQLFQRVHEVLLGKRYLIVLDDVWASEVWDILKFKLPNNMNGSRIVLTTRHNNVATEVASHGHIHHMSLMDVDSSWYLLKRKIFKQDRCPPKLEYIGKLIARSCSGIPLAIELVSGILAADLTQAAWEDILENIGNSIKCDCSDDSFHILCLSYAYLPHHLRACFLYLGMFHEYHQIKISDIIKMLVAEGFLNESVSKSFEETGEEYLEELVKRKLISVVSTNYIYGRIMSFRTHDLVRDLCIRKARQEQFLLYGSRFSLQGDAKEHQRRVIISEFDGQFYNNVYGSTIRTVFVKGRQEGLEGLLENCKLLRILDLTNDQKFLRDGSLPDQAYELIHLRYLAFNCPLYISEAISNLQNLQTLVILPIGSKIQIVKLPVTIWRMRQLRHVVVRSCVLPSQEEEAMAALENLQTLTKAVDFICSRETLKMMPNLKILTITIHLEEDCHLQNFILLQKLETLQIEARGFLEKRCSMSSPAFSPTLKELTLIGLRLPWEDMNIVGSLPNLQVLDLCSSACIGSTWETNEGGFSKLLFLKIDGSDLEDLITEASHFPRLKHLLLPHCRDLKEVPNGIGEIPTLKSIAVDDGNKSLLESARRIQDYQRSLGNYTLEVDILEKEYID